MGKPTMNDYIDVAERIIEFRGKHPDGCLQQVDLQFVEVAGKAWVVYTAAAYRTPDDERPGHGTAWEPVPGPTPFTKDSEVQNAETAAWGRAIVAALAADTKRGVASAQEVRARQATSVTYATTDELSSVMAVAADLGWTRDAVWAWLGQHAASKGYAVQSDWKTVDIRAVEDLAAHLQTAEPKAVPA